MILAMPLLFGEGVTSLSKFGSDLLSKLELGPNSALIGALFYPTVISLLRAAHIRFVEFEIYSQYIDMLKTIYNDSSSEADAVFWSIIIFSLCKYRPVYS